MYDKKKAKKVILEGGVRSWRRTASGRCSAFQWVSLLREDGEYVATMTSSAA